MAESESKPLKRIPRIGDPIEQYLADLLALEGRPEPVWHTPDEEYGDRSES